MQAAHLSKRQQGEAGRAKLMRTALGLFSRKGFEATSVEDICLATGYSKGGFYFHFRGKDDLLLQIVGLDVAVERGDFVQKGWSPGLIVELWALAGRNETLRRCLAKRRQSRRRSLPRAVAASDEDPLRTAPSLLDLLLALQMGLQIQPLLLANAASPLRAQDVVASLIAALEEPAATRQKRRAGAI